MSSGWNQNNQGQSSSQGWPNQTPTNSWGEPQNWSNSQQGNQNWGNSNNGWGQPNQGNNNGWQNQGFLMGGDQQQGGTKSWNEHSGWGIPTQKNEVPAYQQLSQQMPQQLYQQSPQQSYTPLFTPKSNPQPLIPQPQIISQPSSQPSSQQSPSQSSLKIDLSKQHIITTALDSTMTVDVSKEQKNKNQLTLWKKHGESNQRFKFVPVGDRFMIVSMEGNLVLEVEKSSPAKGAVILAGEQTGSPGQLWQLVEAKDSDGGYFIRTFCGKCWDLCEWKTSSGAPIIQYDFNGGKNQIWHIKPY